MRPKLLLDVDGILTDFHSAVARVATMAGFPITSDAMCEWEMRASLRKAGAPDSIVQIAMDSMAYAGFNASLEPDPAALEWVPVIRRLADVVFVTSPNLGCDTWISERVAWMRKHFEIEPAHIIFTGDKSGISGDVFVDDHPVNVASWAAKHPDGVAMLWGAPYNRSSDLRRVGSWEELAEILKS